MQMCLYDRPLERKVTGQVQFGLFCSCSQPGAHFLFKVMGVYFFCWDTLHGMYWIVLLQVLSVGMWYGNCICTMLPSVWKRLILTSIQWWECSVLQWGVTDVLINHSSTMVCSSCPPASQVVSCENDVWYAWLELAEWNWVHHVDADVFVMTAFFKSDLTGSGIRYTFWLCCAINLLVCFSMNTCESLVPTLMRDIFNKSLHSWVLFAVPLKCKLEM